MPAQEAKTLVESALKKSWEWTENTCDIAEKLYNYLDNEERGFTVFQERETNERSIAAWDCIIDANTFVCKNAYLEAGAKYFPEPIESVDDDTIDHMIRSFLLCNGGNENQIKKLYKESIN